MMRAWAGLMAIAAAALGVAVSTQAGTLRGTVLNNTTGKPAAGVEVVLIQLQGGMQPVANSKSDGQGHFTFDNPGIGAQPMLVRAVYHGVNFNTPLRPGGSNDAEVAIYELSKDPKTISVSGHVIIFQPTGAALEIGEEYAVQNSSAPPQAYYRTDGNFEFSVPAKAQLQQVAATGSAGMPVPQAQIERGNDRYAIAYAFRPGETNIRLSYVLPYTGNTASIKIPTVYSGSRLLLVAPPGVQVAGDGLQPAGQEQGMNIYTHEPLPEKAFLSVNLSGTAAATAGPDAGAQSSSELQQGNSRTENANVQAVPGRLDVLKWPLLGGFAVLFVLGALLLARRPVVAMAPAAKAAAAPLYQATAAAPVAVIPPSLAALDAQAGTSLDALKDAIFRLELRRQAGTISEEEYARERAKTEQLLRDLVRG